MALVSVSCCVSWPRVSVCDPQQVMDTDQQVADSSTRDHWDLISELLSTQGGGGTQISSWPHTNHHHVPSVWSVLLIKHLDRSV